MTKGLGIPGIGTVAACNSPEDVRDALRNRAPGKTLRRLAFEIGQNPGTVSAVLKGKRDPSPSLYTALGLTPPVRVVEVAAGFGVGRACPVCGEVHTTKTCVAKRKPRRTVRERFARFMMPGDW
jgi:hypothetical protein